MSQGSEVTSSTECSPTKSLNPVLQAALGSIDVDLEEELARYRRQVASDRAMPGRRRVPRHQRAIDSLDLNPLESTFQAKNSETPPDIDRAQPKAELKPNDSSQASSVPLPQKPTATVGDLVYPRPVPSAPVDNLASSEQLLLSLSEPAPSREKRRLLNNLLTPLGCGYLLLLLLSGATMGYLVMNYLSRSYLGSKQSPPTASVAQSLAPPITASDRNSAEPPIPNGPNLAADEYDKLTLNNLSTLKTTPSPRAATLPPPETLPAATPVVPPATPNTVGKKTSPKSTLLPAGCLTASLSPAARPRSRKGNLCQSAK